jgi:uncharacterized protein
MAVDTVTWRDEQNIRFLLRECGTWAVVGLSGDPSRAAYRIAAFLQDRGKQIVPIHPEANRVLGQEGYPSLADVPFAVDCVDVFRRSSAAGPFADQAVAIGAKGVWFQLGVVDPDAFLRTTSAGVPMVMDVCPLVEWPRHGQAVRPWPA